MMRFKQNAASALTPCCDVPGRNVRGVSHHTCVDAESINTGSLSDNPEKHRKRAVGAHHDLAVEGSDAGPDGGLRHGDNLVDHNLGCLQETVGRGWFNGEAEQGRVNDVGRQEADGHAAERGEQIRLKDERRARLAAVMALCCDGDEVAAR